MTTIPDDMVERVARAILKARYYDCEPGMYGNDVGAFFAGIDSDLVRDAEYEAKAAIEAMQPAILAERERCARVADAYSECERDCGDVIAAAIRKGSD